MENYSFSSLDVARYVAQASKADLGVHTPHGVSSRDPAVSRSPALSELNTDEDLLLTMPELIASLVHVDEDSFLRKEIFRYMCDTEEHVAIDTNGYRGKAGQPIVFVLHGCGFTGRGSIYHNVLEQTAATYDASQATEILSDESLAWFSVREVKKMSFGDLPHRFAVWYPLNRTISTRVPGGRSKKCFVKYPLVIMRAGSSEFLEAYFDSFAFPYVSHDLSFGGPFPQASIPALRPSCGMLTTMAGLEDYSQYSRFHRAITFNVLDLLAFSVGLGSLDSLLAASSPFVDGDLRPDFERALRSAYTRTPVVEGE